MIDFKDNCNNNICHSQKTRNFWAKINHFRVNSLLILLFLQESSPKLVRCDPRAWTTLPLTCMESSAHQEVRVPCAWNRPRRRRKSARQPLSCPESCSQAFLSRLRHDQYWKHSTRNLNVRGGAWRSKGSISFSWVWFPQTAKHD